VRVVVFCGLARLMPQLFVWPPDLREQLSIWAASSQLQRANREGKLFANSHNNYTLLRVWQGRRASSPNCTVWRP